VADDNDLEKPQLDSLLQLEIAPTQLLLLTHDTEFAKLTNSGALVGPALADEPGIQVQRLAWSRVAPDPRVLQLAEARQLMLLYPTPEALVLTATLQLQHDEHRSAATTSCLPLSHTFSPTLLNDNRQLPQIRGFVLLDATWQLAHKMYRQSPYLKTLPTLKLESSQPSQYLLRRNQRQQGWCTAESVALLLAAIGRQDAACKVFTAFHQFNQRN
jgi:DTW domain-containing protein YfiP